MRGKKKYNRLPPAPCPSRFARSLPSAACRLGGRGRLAPGAAPARCLRCVARLCRLSVAVVAFCASRLRSRRLRPCRAAAGAERARSASPPRLLPLATFCVLLAARASPCALLPGCRCFGRVGGVCGSSPRRLAPFPPGVAYRLLPPLPPSGAAAPLMRYFIRGGWGFALGPAGAVVARTARALPRRFLCGRLRAAARGCRPLAAPCARPLRRAPPSIGGVAARRVLLPLRGLVVMGACCPVKPSEDSAPDTAATLRGWERGKPSARAAALAEAGSMPRGSADPLRPRQTPNCWAAASDCWAAASNCWATAMVYVSRRIGLLTYILHFLQKRTRIRKAGSPIRPPAADKSAGRGRNPASKKGRRLPSFSRSHWR